MIGAKLRAAQKGGVSLDQSAVNNTALTGGAAQTITTSYPTTPVEGRLLVAVYAPRTVFANILGTGAPAEGWSNAVNLNRGTTMNISIWWKVAGASEPTAVTFNTAPGAGNIHQFLDVFSFAGADVVSPIDQTASVDGGASTVTTLPAPLSVTPTLAGELVIAAVGTAAAAGAWGAWSGGFSRPVNPNPASTDRLVVGHLVQASAAAASTNVTWSTTQLAAGVIASFKAAA